MGENEESHPVHGNIKLALEALVQQRLGLQYTMSFSCSMQFAAILSSASATYVIRDSFLIFSFCYSRYLQKDKVSGPEGHTLFYEFAERALDEAVNRRIREYVKEVI